MSNNLQKLVIGGCCVFVFVFFGLGFSQAAFAQFEHFEPLITDTLPIDEYFIGEVLSIEDEELIESGGYTQFFQLISVKMLSGPDKGAEMVVEHGGLLARTSLQTLSPGEKVVLVKTQTGSGDTYFIAEHYRIPNLAVILAVFLGLVILFGRFRGLSSILGLGVSILVLVFVIVPQIIAGENPLFVSMWGAALVAVISLYLAHGFNKKTNIALLGTLVTLGLSIVMAQIFVGFANLFGFGSDEAFYLQIMGSDSINLRGLLLGGIIIGVLGVLDDITIGQAATVQEIHRANSSLGFTELYTRGIRVGREHIASLVNTLVFAYAGAAFPLLLLFTLDNNIPLWVTLNSELIAEEVVRTLVGSISLIFAVPITTVMAAYFFAKEKNTGSGLDGKKE